MDDQDENWESVDEQHYHPEPDVSGGCFYVIVMAILVMLIVIAMLISHKGRP